MDVNQVQGILIDTQKLNDTYVIRHKNGTLLHVKVEDGGFKIGISNPALINNNDALEWNNGQIVSMNNGANSVRE